MGGEKGGEEEKPMLVDYDSLPAYLKDNEYILKYYRAEWPVRHLLLSVFSLHNETLNIWTHLVGSLVFAMLMGSMAIDGVPTMDAREDLCTRVHLNQTDAFFQQGNFDTARLVPVPVPRWPLMIFLGGAVFCLFSSTLCHTLSCHSKRLSYLMHLLDYAGIAVLISTSFYPSVYYSFLHHPLPRLLYLSSISTLAIATVALSLLPIFQTPRLRAVRALVFFIMGISGVVPVLHKMALFGDHSEAAQTTMGEVVMGVVYAVGAFIYAARVPERWQPGRFDMVGSSHQVFHVLVVAAACVHYHSGLVYLQWRERESGC